MNAIHLKALSVIVIFTITGCATTFKPHTPTCLTYGASSVDIGKRESAKYFSILPPSGNWCFVGGGGDYGILFKTDKVVGRYLEEPPSKENLAHTFFVMVRSLKVKDVDMKSTSSIKDFVKKWYEVAANVVPVGGEPHVELTASEETKRFELVNLVVDDDDTFDADCVHYSATFNEKDNPYYKPWIMKMDEDGYICRSPGSNKILVQAYFSERHREGVEDLALSRNLKLEAEEALKSLEFLIPIVNCISGGIRQCVERSQCDSLATELNSIPDTVSCFSCGKRQWVERSQCD